MGARSKRRVTRRRCVVCGMPRWEYPGVRSPCPYKALHRAVASAPPFDSSGTVAA